MSELSAFDRGGKRTHDSVLAYQIGEREGAPRTVQGHGGPTLAGRFAAPAGGYGCNESARRAVI